MTHQRAWGSVAIRLFSTLSYPIGYKTMFIRLCLAVGDSILQAAFDSVLGEKDDYSRWVYPETASSLKHEPSKFIGKNWNCIGTWLYLNYIMEIKPKKLLHTPDWGKSLIPLPRLIKRWTLNTAMAKPQQQPITRYLTCVSGTESSPTWYGLCYWHTPYRTTCLSTYLPIWTWIWPTDFLILTSGSVFSYFGLILQLYFQTWL